MSLPNVPDITPDINVSKKKALNLLLVSIALEEIGMSHILNAEGEKIQAAIKNFEQEEDHSKAFHDLLLTNRSVQKTLRSLIKKEMLLQFKMEDIVELYQTEGFEEDDDKY